MTPALHQRVGNALSLRAAARATPAGLVLGVLVSSIILSVTPRIWAVRRQP